MFRENDIEYENVNYFIEPLSEERLRNLLKKAGLAPFEVVRKKEPAFQELNLTPETSPDEIIRALVEHPGLLQRPIVEIGDRAVVARPIEKALELISSAK